MPNGLLFLDAARREPSILGLRQRGRNANRDYFDIATGSFTGYRGFAPVAESCNAIEKTAAMLSLRAGRRLRGGSRSV
jgi:hypothetical protein